MTLTPQDRIHSSRRDAAAQAAAARDHLWMHFTRMSAYAAGDVPVITRGEGPTSGTPRASATSTGSPGCSSCRPATAAPSWPRPRAKQASELAFFPLWSYAHPKAIELAERLADLAPGDLNRVFFTTGGGEAVESAWKVAKQYFKLTGKPMKHKVISRYDRLPRHAAGRAVHHRHPGRQGDVRAAGARRPQGAEHELLPRARARRRPRGVRPLGRRPDRGGHRVRRPRDGRRGVPRAGAELRRLLPAAARLLPAGPRDLRPARRAAGLRRGDLRVRPARPLLRCGSASATSRTSSPAPRA